MPRICRLNPDVMTIKTCTSRNSMRMTPLKPRTMRVNDALMDEEVEDGYVLTCQAVPDTANVTVDYEE